MVPEKDVKMSPEDLKNLRWGSHIPANTSILKSFPITGVLELGAGYNSTPLFFNECKTAVSIENDLDWINKLKQDKLIETETKKLIHHALPEYINRSTHRRDIPKNILRESINFYESHITPDINFLFVDGYAGLRLEALEKLYTKFDVITYHDAEPRFDHCYDYSLFKPNKDYVHIFDRSFPANVGILVSKKYENLIVNFENNFNIEAQKYADKFNSKFKPNLEKNK
jgi:hypothetical protein